jgi:hypothetical protein
VTARRIKGYLVVGAGLVITFSGVINNFLGLNPLAGTMVILAFAAVVMGSAAVIISENEVMVSGFAVGFIGLLDGFSFSHWRYSSPGKWILWRVYCHSESGGYWSPAACQCERSKHRQPATSTSWGSLSRCVKYFPHLGHRGKSASGWGRRLARASRTLRA